MAERVVKFGGAENAQELQDSTALKRGNFVRLAEKRTVNAIKAIRVIGKLGNRSAYDYNDEDVKKIVKALSDEIEALKLRMKSTKRADGVQFKLDS